MTNPITPIVDRCWVSITSAIHNKFWAALIGPKNYNKLATVRDLAMAMGKFFFSYTCSPNTSIHTLEKLIIGTAGSMSWVAIENANDLQIGRAHV